MTLMAQTEKDPPAMRETWIRSLGWEDSLEEGMVTHSSILAWRIPYSPWDLKELDTTEQLRTHSFFCMFFDSLYKLIVHICVVYFWALISVSLIYVSVFLPVT